ncbi:hypothetical protein EDI_154110 [Entamoeba dispar SAW760]|uniref:Proteasome assembly chaperone 3 n=1 Tax=Entamoeba dispar (strain ATCC PRA-260 / SAW760) TaxID=370354 RepID=B0E607_ENTDS|nr:uncharacterized protein EDI_154110 [Entamoeba dispar SAW760]EDR30044.1 hypothetical protein EDI_154110 [Entamoeba dispar SAW760]|eukprot:EDR30044.1 hypothetical protein EDI_154110 [Entamoeba dispar SAW760]
MAFTKPSYSLVKGTEKQYTITTTINSDYLINVSITQYSDTQTMLICLSDCGCFSQWVVCTQTSTELRFGKSNSQNPFPTALSRQLFLLLGGVETLIVAIGIRNPSPEKLKLIVSSIQQVLSSALHDISQQLPHLN